MKEKLIDRRVRRTRRLFLDALVSLLQEKGYEAITVQDILERADLGRSTFYAHFRGKDDLLVSGFADLQREFDRHRSGAGKGSGDVWDLGWFWFRHIEHDRRVCKALLGTPGSGEAREQVRAHLARFLSGLVREQMKNAPTGPAGPKVSALVVHYIAGALVNLTTWWLDERMPFTGEQMSALFERITRPGIEAVLKQVPADKKTAAWAERN